MAEVFYCTMRANIRTNLLDKVGKLLNKIGLSPALSPGQLVAVKLHFGEKGNTAFIRPPFVRRVVDEIKKTGAIPFLTDTNTLYRGSREDAASHLNTATTNGFAYSVAGAPLIIADGLRANDEVEVTINGEHNESLPIGSAIHKADALVALSHFKLHEATGFGGALKNLGMGCASRRGKLSMHSTLTPYVKTDECRGDEICLLACRFDAISMVDSKANIHETNCVGCGECIGVCPHKAIQIKWDAGARHLQEKMAEFAKGAVAGKKGLCFYVNFVTRITPACDCYGHSDASIVPDLGIFASLDPVALDQACAEAVNNSQGLQGSALSNAFEPGQDKFRDIYPSVDWTVQLTHAEKMGLGTRIYKIVKLG